MKFVRIIDGYDHLWAVKAQDKKPTSSHYCSGTGPMVNTCLTFFMENFEDLQQHFHIERLDEAVNDTFEDAEALQELVLEIPYTEHLDELFKPLDITDARAHELSREKAPTGTECLCRNRGRHQTDPNHAGTRAHRP